MPVQVLLMKGAIYGEDGVGAIPLPDLFDPREWAFSAVGNDYAAQHAMYEHLHQFLQRNPGVNVLDTLDRMMGTND